MRQINTRKQEKESSAGPRQTESPQRLIMCNYTLIKKLWIILKQHLDSEGSIIILVIT